MASVIEVKNLKKYFDTPKGKLHAVDDVSLQIEEGKTLGVVGESGCGKSTLGRTMIHLLESTGGNIIFEGKDVTRVSSRQLHQFRKKVQIVFQDPFSSLNPRMTIKETIQEPLRLSHQFNRRQIEEETEKLMDLVGIEERLRNAYPHELDGGRRQRVGIGRAIALNPKFIVCDEPVSALDVSIQAQVLNLLRELQRKKGLTYMFITHDLSVVRHISDNICVMYLGQVVELSPSKELFNQTLHPYAKSLLSAIPSVDLKNRKQRQILSGEIVSPVNPAPGCRFAARCQYAQEKCKEPQVLEELLSNHFVACCRARELNDL